MPSARPARLRSAAEAYHWRTGTIEVGHLQGHLLTTGGGDDPLRQAFADVGEDLGQPGGLVLPLGLKACLAQRGLHRPGRGPHTRLTVGEQVNVLGRPADHPVLDQGVAAAQGEPVPGGGPQRDDRHLTMQLIQRHQTARAEEAARSAGCSSSQARRTPFGRYRSRQITSSTSRLR